MTSPLNPVTTDNGTESTDSLTDQVTTRLRLAIVTGALSAGERVSEPLLAEQLQVSRSPVREALHRLEEERLIERLPNRRIAVWLPTERDVGEIFSLRVMLESLAAELVVNQLTDEHFARLDEMVQHQEALIGESEYLQLIHEDKSFHEYFILHANHVRLREWWQQIMGQWEVLIYRRMHHAPNRVVPSIVPDHRDLIEAYRARDLQQITYLHRVVNARVEHQTKEAVRSRQRIGEIRI